MVYKIPVMRATQAVCTRGFHFLTCQIAKSANRLINKLANHFLIAKLLSEPLLQSRGIYLQRDRKSVV